MITAVLVFGFIIAAFEFFLLYKFGSPEWLKSEWTFWTGFGKQADGKYGFKRTKVRKSTGVHLVVIGLNLAIHWGTLVGTMAATLSGLISFMLVPFVIWIKTPKPNVWDVACKVRGIK